MGLLERYSVWVGGGEINDRLLTEAAALFLAEGWKAEGYDDVIVEEVLPE
jgi:hypothetical protein